MKKRFFCMCLMLASLFSTASYADGYSFVDGRIVEDFPYPDRELEQLATQVEEQTVEFANNSKGKDSGDVFIRWGQDVFAAFGCSLMEMYYINPGYSNLGVKVELILTDDNLTELFGTTFKSNKELNELALAGFRAMQVGVLNKDAMSRLVIKGVVATNEYDYPLSYVDFAKVLVENNYLGYSLDDWLGMTEEKLLALNEYEKLMIAQFGDYKFYRGGYLSLGETGIINPGYEITIMQLHTFGEDDYVLPGGDYAASLLITPYDAERDEYSKISTKVPVMLHVEQDLPKELQEEYGIKLAVKVN